MNPEYFERPYVVEVGDPEYDFYQQRMGVSWTFHRAFNTREDAEAYAERIAEDYEVVLVRKKENEGDFLSPKH